MDFQLTQDQLQLQDAARKFARAELPALAQALEASNHAVPDDMLKRYGEMGFLGINIDEQYGGMGLGNLEALLVVEEFARISGAVAFPVFESCTGPVRAIERFGTQTLKDRVIPAVCRGDLIIAISMSESEAGTALTDLRTRATLDGDSVVIDGSKRWCSGGGHAGGYLVYCRMSEAAGAKGIGAVYVDKDAPGLSFGRPEELMGFRGVPSCDLYFDKVRVPKDQIVVPAGGFAKLMEAFDLERCGNATMSLAQGAAALERAGLRAGAQAVRTSAGGVPGRATPPGRHEDEDRGGPPADPSCGGQCQSWSPQHRRFLAGQVLRQHHRARGHRRRDAVDGRLRLFEGVPDGAAPAR